MVLLVQWLSAIAALAAAALWFASTQVKTLTGDEPQFRDLPLAPDDGMPSIDLAMLEVRVLKKQARLNRYAAAASAAAAAFQAVTIMLVW